jgi:Alcohol dehydrogenase GroES-like domain
MPAAGAGSAVVKVLATYLLPYNRDMLENRIPYPISLPIVPGSDCIGRVAAVGSDTVELKPGQLVFAKTHTIARDCPDASITVGLIGDGPAKSLTSTSTSAPRQQPTAHTSACASRLFRPAGKLMASTRSRKPRMWRSGTPGWGARLCSCRRGWS